MKYNVMHGKPTKTILNLSIEYNQLRCTIFPMFDYWHSVPMNPTNKPLRHNYKRELHENLVAFQISLSLYTLYAFETKLVKHCFKTFINILIQRLHLQFSLTSKQFAIYQV